MPEAQEAPVAGIVPTVLHLDADLLPRIQVSLDGLLGAERVGLPVVHRQRAVQQQPALANACKRERMQARGSGRKDAAQPGRETLLVHAGDTRPPPVEAAAP